MKTLVFAFLALALALAKPAMAAPADNPNFPTHEQVQTMIDQAIDQIDSGLTADQVKALIATALADKKPAEPPIEFFIKENVSKFENSTITIVIGTKASDGYTWSQANRFIEFEIWGIAHLPNGKVFATNTWGMLRSIELTFEIPTELIPPSETDVPIEIHCSYAGKTWQGNVELTALPRLQKPTYVSNNVQLNHGSYGNSGVPILIFDETGNDLFDGIYGSYDWLKTRPITSLDDYNERYDAELGFGIPWVSWQTYYAPAVITVDMKEITNIQKIGLHCYFKTPDIYLPNRVIVEASDNGADFTQVVDQACNQAVADASVNWLEISTNFNARFFRLKAYTDWPGDLFVDEMAINGLDGSDY